MAHLQDRFFAVGSLVSQHSADVAERDAQRVLDELQKQRFVMADSTKEEKTRASSTSLRWATSSRGPADPAMRDQVMSHLLLHWPRQKPRAS